MKKLPIGIQTFSRLIRGGYGYVDKTPLIQPMMREGGYYFLARPRRFGKSLLVSTLKSAFRGERELFEGLHLASYWDWQRAWPVVHLSLGRGCVADVAELTLALGAMLDEVAEEWGLSLTHQRLADRFAELLRKLHDETPVVVLIDEYDKPILDHLDNRETAEAMRGALRDFYSVLKESDEHLHFVLLTGVSKFTKVSLFSGLNNLKDISLDGRYATLCGYTEAEIRRVFGDYLEGVEMERLREWYNGYNFLGERVYNPYDVLLYLDRRRFENYWFETGSPLFLMKLLRECRYPIPALERVTASDTLFSGFDPERMSVETLMFQTGYLTIVAEEELEGERFYTLGYPNREVKSSFTRHLLDYLSGAPGEVADNRIAIHRALANGDLAALRASFQALFAAIPHDWYRKNRLSEYEGYYAALVYCYFAASGLEVTAEDSTNKGRIDLTVKLRDRLYIIEFKVAEAGGDHHALEQIKAKGDAEKYRAQGLEIWLVGVAFSSRERNIVDFRWERG